MRWMPIVSTLCFWMANTASAACFDDDATCSNAPAAARGLSTEVKLIVAVTTSTLAVGVLVLGCCYAKRCRFFREGPGDDSFLDSPGTRPDLYRRSAYVPIGSKRCFVC